MSEITIADYSEQYRDSQGQEYSARNPIIGWIELKLSRATTQERQHDILINIFMMTFGAAMISAIVALWMGRGIVRPIVRLRNAVDSMRNGDLGTRIDTHAGGEIGALEHGFNQMASSMEVSQNHLHEQIKLATSNLSLLLESLPVAVFRSDPDDIYSLEFITPKAKQLTGFDAEYFIKNKSLWIERIHPDDRETLIEKLQHITEVGFLELEYRWLTASGEYNWYYSFLRLIDRSDGKGMQVIGMWQDITEVKRISQTLTNTIGILESNNQKLEIARKNALAISEEKANFLANMSHEIRTPLSSIIGYAEKMETHFRKYGISDDSREYLRIINHATKHIKHIIDDILSFSKLESGTLQLDKSPFDLRECLEDVICMMSSEIIDQELELALFISSDVPIKLIGDPKRINQVVINLLGNAIKFTDHGSIDIQARLRSATLDHAEIEIRVCDTGIGMTDAVTKNIFKPFYQGDTSVSRNYQGTGLGLSIVSKLVDLWGGELGVSSTPGEGSIFWFSLSCNRQLTDDGCRTDIDLIGKKILLYDDYPLTMKCVRNYLMSWSCRIFLARSRCQIKPLLDAALSDGDPFDLAIIGTGINAMMAKEAVSLGLDVLLNLIRQDHETPILLLTNRMQTEAINSTLINHENIVVLEKPIRRRGLYQQLCRLTNSIQNLPTAVMRAEHAGTETYRGLRVLVAEDNEFNRELIKAVLEARGLIVSHAGNGRQALALADSETFDIMIMDIHLPGMNGMEAAKIIRALKPCYRSIPIIALTADIFFNEPNRLAECGIDACLLKPLEEEKLWLLLNTLLKTTPDRFQPDDQVHTNPPPSDGLNEFHGIPLKIQCTVPEDSALFEKLKDSLRTQCSQIDHAIRDGNHPALPGLIHELKGVVCYFGLKDLSPTVIELEKLLLGNDELTDAGRLLSQISAVVDSLAKA